MSGFLSFEEARRSARRRLPRGLFDYIDRGVGEEASLRALRTRLDAAEITPRMLVGTDKPDTCVTLFGQRHEAPFIIAPTAMAGLVHRSGEEALARAAARCGVPFCLSTQSLSSVEGIARSGTCAAASTCRSDCPGAACRISRDGRTGLLARSCLGQSATAFQP